MHRVAFTLIAAVVLLAPGCGKGSRDGAAAPDTAAKEREPLAVLREARSDDDPAVLSRAVMTLAARRSDPESFRAVVEALDHPVPAIRQAAAKALADETRPIVLLRRLERLDAFFGRDDRVGRDPDDVLVEFVAGLAAGRGDAMAIARLERAAALPDGAADRARAAAREILGRFVAKGLAASQPIVGAQPPRLRRFDSGDPRGLMPAASSAPGTIRSDWRIDADSASFRWTLPADEPLPDRLWLDHCTDDPRGVAFDVQVNGKQIVRLLAQPLFRSHLLPIPQDLLRRGPNEFTFKRAVGGSFRLTALHIEDHP